MWEFTSAAAYSAELERLLRDGWEPFAVIPTDQARGDRQKVHVVYLRRFRGPPKAVTVKT